jgi:hypothetical protein
MKGGSVHIDGKAPFRNRKICNRDGRFARRGGNWHLSLWNEAMLFEESEETQFQR